MVVPAQLTPLAGSERPRPPSHQFVGPADPTQVIGITLLVRPQPGSPPLPDLAHWQETPPGKRRFLTPDEYARTYGADQADLDAVAAFAAAHALTVLESNAGRCSVSLRGTVGQMNAAFGITLNQYTAPLPASPPHTSAGRSAPATAGTQSHHGYDGAVHLPPDLANIVVAAVGLDNRSQGGAGGSSGDPPSSQQLSVPAAAKYYNFPNTGAADQTIGVIAPSDPPGPGRRLSGYLANDITNLYFPNLSDSSYRTKPVLNDVSLTVGTNVYTNNTGSVISSNNFALEVTQDISTCATVAQGATINVYFTELTEQGLVVCLNRILLPPEGEKQPTVVTCSFNFYGSDGSIGSVSTSGSPAAVMSTLFQQIAALGINVFIISQDKGSNDGVTDGAAHVNYPGSDPWVTSVGGTVIGGASSASPQEWVWSNVGSTSPVGGFGGASGGGASATFPSPSYQTSADITQITDSKGNKTSNQRFIPDVAGMVAYGGSSSSATADWFYINGSTSNFVGTSCACPLYAGLAAVLRSAFGLTLGFLNPTLYQLGKSSSPPFNDITNGNNDPADGSGAPYYTAGTGWDACTGWGSIDGTKLLNAIAKLLYNQTFYFQVEKSTYGLDEVGVTSSYPTAFWLVLEGFTPTAASGAVPTVSGVFASLSGVTVTVGAQKLELPSQLSTPQRILYPCSVSFAASAIQTVAKGGIFPATGSAALSVALSAQITVGGSSLPASTVFELAAGSDPYFANINPRAGNVFYLSQDLRLFTVTPGVNNAPIASVPLSATDNTSFDTAAGFNYIQALLTNLNTNYSNPSGTDPFTLFPDQSSALTGDSSVTPFTINPASVTSSNPAGTNFANYNFAVARVRLNGTASTTTTSNVRVFFRVFTTQSNDTDYQSGTTYPSNSDSAGFPGSPQLGADNTTIPFFATGNYQANSDFAANVDYTANSVNNQPIKTGSSGSIWAYYGCYLNFYPTGNTINGQILQSLLTGTHHCLVAQIAFDGAPIPSGGGTVVSPENSDKLAQRNLQITLSDNPGPPATHRIPQTFDLRPSGAVTPTPGELQNYPDELMIDWGNTPVGSTATIYWPQVNAADVLTLAKQLYSTHQLQAVDANTLQFTATGGVTFVPIPPGRGQNLAGLFTIDLPTGIVYGQTFTVVVRRLTTQQVTPPPPPPPIPHIASLTTRAASSTPTWRGVVGTFAVSIPVSSPAVMLPLELNTLAIMKWRVQQMSPSNRWYPVLLRYVNYIAGRVDGLGGNSGSVLPSPWGAPLLPKEKRVVLKVWRRNDILCDNAGEIDFLTNQGWIVAGRDKLSVDRADGTSEVLYLLTNVSPTVAIPPAFTIPAPIVVSTGSTVLLTCSMTRGRMVFRDLDDPKAADVALDPSTTGIFPVPVNTFLTVSFNILGSIACSRSFALLCINDSAPPDLDGYGQACWAEVHVEAYVPGAVASTPSNPQVVINADQVPAGQSHVYYLVFQTL